MILAIDVGNTNIVLGCIENAEISNVVRVHTAPSATMAEYAIQLAQLFDFYGSTKTALRARSCPPSSQR